MSRRAPRLPVYRDTHPPHLATADELEAQGLKPGTVEPVALYKYQSGDCSGTCGLFERAAAVPKVQEAS